YAAAPKLPVLTEGNVTGFRLRIHHKNGTKVIRRKVEVNVIADAPIPEPHILTTGRADNSQPWVFMARSATIECPPPRNSSTAGCSGVGSTKVRFEECRELGSRVTSVPTGANRERAAPINSSAAATELSTECSGA